MIVGYKVMTGAIKGLDNARKILEDLRGLGYNEAGIKVDDLGHLYSVVVLVGHDKRKLDKAREDVERVTGKRAAVQFFGVN